MSTLSTSQSSGKKRKAVNVCLLNEEQYTCFVDVKSKFQDVFNQVAIHLTLRETEYFGLAFKKDDGEYQFVTNDEKIYKHAPKIWKNGPGDGFDGHGLPILCLHFRVQFYVDQVVLLREKVTRHLYYLQLKDNVLNYRHGCLEEKCFQVAAYALQADYGNYTPAEMEGYFDPREYFPAWMVEKHGSQYLVENTPIVHKDLQNLPRSEAEWRFIKETSVSPAAHNLHFYRLRKKKTDKTWNTLLGICAKGIEIYEDLEDGFKDLISTFLWPDIGKLTFDKKKFEIRTVGHPTGRKFTYYTDSDVKSKYLLTLSRNTHIFQMAIQPKLMEIRHLEEEDKRRYRESYISSDPRDHGSTGGSYRTNISPRTKPAMANRYSVVSDASSNTTSGIASDKMTISFEDSDEVGREIIIDGPPISAMLLHTTPSQTRSKIVSTLPGYKPSPLPGANRSPVLGQSDQFSAYTFPSRGQIHTSPFHLSNQNNISSGSVQSDRSGSGQSEALSLGSGSSGSYRKRMKQQQQQQTGTYNSPVLPVYSPVAMEGAREKSSRPVSRSTSRKDSFKEILAQLQAHPTVGAMASTPPSQPRLVDTPQLKHVPSFHMEDLDYLPRPASRSGSSDYKTNLSFASDLSNPSSLPTSVSTVTSNLDYQNVAVLATSYGSSDSKLTDSEDHAVVLGVYQDEHGMLDVPTDLSLHMHHSQEDLEQQQQHLQQQLRLADFDLQHHMPQEQLQQPEHEQLQVEQEIEQVTSDDVNDDDIYEDDDDDDEDDDDVLGATGGVSKNTKPTHITVNNQKEVLHPEIEEIRDKSHAVSLPFITALCSDKTLLSLHSYSGSIAGSYDMSSIRSTDSRISRISHETDVRRLSVNYPSSASGTLVSTTSNRPFSWHSESFDLDAQLANLNLNNVPLTENHRSVPQNLYDFTDGGSWTDTISYAMPTGQGLDRYSPELIASQLNIPPKISSGGHSSTEANIRHKSLMKENVGIA